MRIKLKINHTPNMITRCH